MTALQSVFPAPRAQRGCVTASFTCCGKVFRTACRPQRRQQQRRQQPDEPAVMCRRPRCLLVVIADVGQCQKRWLLQSRLPQKNLQTFAMASDSNPTALQSFIHNSMFGQPKEFLN